jgi:hypothetical protein
MLPERSCSRPPAVRQSGTMRSSSSSAFWSGDSNDTLRSAGRAFNEVKDERTAADYDETIVPSPEDAKQAQQAANDFLAICGAAYGLRPTSP